MPVQFLLTLHNPYDQPLEHSELRWILRDPPPGPSVLASMLAIHTGPVSTVSRAFAHELLSDPLFTDVYADHLQHQLRRRGVIGIDNGMFGTYRFPFSSEIRLAAESGDFEPLIMAKNLRRKGLATLLERYERFLEAETSHNPALADELVSWGEPLDLGDESRPLFFMMGRDDPRQKGYDLAAAAISRLPRGAARFVFTPMAGVEGLYGLEFLRRLAEERPGEGRGLLSIASPTDVFRSLQRGSSFMLMPSLYRPFGGASEAYLAGIPVVARPPATSPNRWWTPLPLPGYCSASPISGPGQRLATDRGL